jgi:predicted unusual protein kinase regulating ubiquinone biosynthesis (AarF/ABC1/UbiB family)
VTPSPRRRAPARWWATVRPSSSASSSVVGRAAASAAGRTAAAVTAATVAAVTSASLRRRRSAPAPVLGGSRARRNLTLAAVGARGGRRWARHRARRTFASAERRAELDTRFQLETAADVANALGNMKGALMKLGQMASYVDSGLPDHVRDTLAQLQRDAPPMSPELTAEMIERELGASPERLFAEWDPEPIASASIGQVHRAITVEGQAVAVKVQYPGVAEAVAADLGNAGLLFGGLATMFPALEPGPIVAELQARITEELDYRAEAANQRQFARYFDGHPFVTVPPVVDAYCADRVLTSELATGARFAEVVEWPVDERNLAAETLFRFSFGSIYRLHAFNGDPHPGNYLFQPGGRVTFLDFGLVKRFTSDETALFQRLIRAMVIERDSAAFRQVVESAGILRPGSTFSDAEIEDYFSFYYSYVLRDGPITIDQDYAAAGVKHIFDATGPHGELKKLLNVPPSFVVLQRITLGLMGLFARLEATADWRRIAMELWPSVGAPPSTETGRTIERWGHRSGARSGYEGL